MESAFRAPKADSPARIFNPVFGMTSHLTEMAAAPHMGEAAPASADPAKRMSPLLWRLNRLRCMSPAEVGHRLLRLAQIQAERLARQGTLPHADLSLAPAPWLSVPSGLDAAPYQAAAERLVDGRFDVFALEDIELG